MDEFPQSKGPKENIDNKKATFARIAISVFVLLVMLSPIWLNLIWGNTHIEVLYWISRLLCYGQLLLLGSLILAFPTGLGRWLNRLWYPFKSNGSIDNLPSPIRSWVIRILSGLLLLGSSSLGLYLLLRRLIK